MIFIFIIYISTLRNVSFYVRALMVSTWGGVLFALGAAELGVRLVGSTCCSEVGVSISIEVLLTLIGWVNWF